MNCKNVMLVSKNAHCPRVVTWGMSCVGKTTMAGLMNDHAYFCFDAMFNWHEIETLGLSINANLKHIRDICEPLQNFVIDGWHLADNQGLLFPKNTTAYVLYDEYDSIINRYRVKVDDRMQHISMYRKWYDIRLSVPVRYFKNNIESIIETDVIEFQKCVFESI